jgi:sulfoxide reductase heme-binding subunit YedZ
MGRKWRRLHQTVYVAAILTYLHWVLTAFDPTMGYVHGAVAAVLLLARLRRDRRSATPARDTNPG